MKVIALQGIRGGVGTTAIVAGLAQAAHEQGARVLAVDLCPDNQLGIHLGLPHDDPGGWSRLTQPAREWRGALHRREEGLDLLSHGGGEGASAEWLAGIGGYDLVLPDLARGSRRMPTALGASPATPGRTMSVCW
ncbi:cellulose synthase operon protein YhjQ/BcsQ [Aeromonas caviae]|uniref:cellulose synthase operon protein YhjQ/BcsQ n=1 Tax=Aeromonas caviae TaxID=648 RepID=UPI00069B08BC|nr:cellulose synthase operon protein YhjQ/BcsQ [Aeromonas caviae]